jgi:signal transduction histidine kinase
MISQNITIMVVEDEMIIGMDINDTLVNLGYQVTDVIPSGEEAIAKASEIKPDLILMDIMLAGDIKGTQAGKEIKDLLNIPVVYLTAHTDIFTLNQAKETAPFGYIVKPFTERELYTAIEIAITRYQAEMEVRKALATEKELNNLKSRFISMVSHEFRTPLFTILLSAGLLEKYSSQWSEDKKINHIHRIQSSVEHMTNLLEDVLVIGQAESGKIECNPVIFDLKNFCQEMTEEMQLLVVEKQTITLFYRDIATKEYLQLDEKILRHILGNLLLNAIKYSYPGGQVRFEVICENEKVIFHIQDQGIGIPPEDKAKIFEPFHRATNVGNISGTGLGLAIVKRFVDLHQGEITVESQVGEGTEFTVTLPLNNIYLK